MTELKSDNANLFKVAEFVKEHEKELIVLMRQYSVEVTRVKAIRSAFGLTLAQSNAVRVALLEQQTARSSGDFVN